MGSIKLFKITKSRSVLLAMTCALALQANAAEPLHVDVPSGDLITALEALAKQSGVEFFYKPDQLKGLRTLGVSGNLRVTEAVTKLLEGTPLTLRTDKSSGALLIATPSPNDENELSTSSSYKGVSRAVPAGVAYAQANSSSVLNASSEESTAVAGSSTTAPSSVISEVVVTSRIITTQNDAFGATKMGLPIAETPFSVIPVTEDMIDIASIRGVGDLYKIDPSGSPTHQDGYGSSRIRGFDGKRRIDGFREGTDVNVELDMVSFERIELIKGGTSTLYGQTEPGGVVNYVSKLPEKESAVRMRGEVGSYDYYRYEGDITGPVTSTGEWSYRLLGAVQKDDTFRVDGQNDRVAIVPSLMYRGDRTSIIFRAHYEELKLSGNFSPATQLSGPLPVEYGGDWASAVADGAVGIRLIPDSVRRGGVPYSASGLGADHQVLLLQSQIEHRLGADWTLRANLQYMDVLSKQIALAVFGPYDDSGRAIRDHQLFLGNQLNGYSAEINIFGNVEAFGREHLLFFGADYADQERAWTIGLRPYLGYDASRVNLFTRPEIPVLSASEVGLFPLNDRNTYAGITAQTVLNPVEHLKVMIGGRYNSDRAGSGAGSSLYPSFGQALNAAESVDDYPMESTSNFTKQFGVVYELTANANLYAAYSESYVPTSSRQFSASDAAGKLLPAPEGTTYEVGLKGSLSKDLAYSLAAFEIEQDIVIADVDHPGFSALVGGRRNRGVELSLQGRVSPAINLFGGMAYQDSEYIAGPAKGFRSATAPRIGLTLFGTYEFLQGPLQGFGIGAGVVHKGDRKGGDVTRNIRIAATGEPYIFNWGAYTEVDARLFYNRNNWGIYAAATNLLDERYYELGAGDVLWYGQHVNPGRMFRIGVDVKL